MGTGAPAVAIRSRTRRGKARAGDPEVFAALYAEHEQELFRYCRSILRSEEDARDALQNTMVKAFTALQTERRDLALRPWLFRIAHNEAISLVRRRPPTSELDETLGGADDTVHRTVETRERLAHLRADLQDLPERQRGALVMRELSGLSHEEIGAALGTSARAVKQTLYEARTSLNDCAEGRAMRCEAVQRALSDGDGRVSRSRRMRAHLRDCRSCERFRVALVARPAELAALAPVVPLLGAPAILATLEGVLTAGGAAVSGTGAMVGAGAATGTAAGTAGMPAATAAVSAGTGAVSAGTGAGVGATFLAAGGAKLATVAATVAVAGAAVATGPSVVPRDSGPTATTTSTTGPRGRVAPPTVAAPGFRMPSAAGTTARDAVRPDRRATQGAAVGGPARAAGARRDAAGTSRSGADRPGRALGVVRTDGSRTSAAGTAGRSAASVGPATRRAPASAGTTGAARGTGTARRATAGGAGAARTQGAAPRSARPARPPAAARKTPILRRAAPRRGPSPSGSGNPGRSGSDVRPSAGRD